MAQNKTKPTGKSVKAYIASRASEAQRADCDELLRLLGAITKARPKMWGPSIVGFGSYRYVYESGRTGEAPLVGFAVRGSELVVYILAEGEAQRTLLAKLGPHRMGRSCLYLKSLADVDRAVLKRLVAGSVAGIRRRYG